MLGDDVGIVLRRGNRADIAAVALFQLMPVAHRPQVDVGFGAMGEAFQHAPLLGDLNDRFVDVAVPVGDGFLTVAGRCQMAESHSWWPRICSQISS